MGMPDAFMRTVVDAPLPEPGHYAAGIAFLDRDTAACGRQQQAIAAIVREEGLEPLAWRAVPTDPNGLGLQALASMPAFVTLVVASPDGSLGGLDLERKAFRIRKRVEHEVGVYFASLSGRTITYKGMLTTMQLTGFFPDLNDERMAARVAIVHSRFSTNTFPSWPLAQPFACWPTTARSTPSRATATGCRPRGTSELRTARRVRAAAADRHARLFGLRHLRRVSGAAAPGRPQPAARHPDDAAARPGRTTTRSTPTCAPSTSTTTR